MKRSLILIHSLVALSLLTSCAGSASALWGVQPTPTQEMLPSPIPSDTARPAEPPTAEVTMTPSITPLAVIPMPDTPTSSPSPTETNNYTPTITATITLTPTATRTMKVATVPVDTATLPPVNTSGPMNVYTSQGGDTLNILASRFGISVHEIVSDQILPAPDELIHPGTLLLVPKVTDPSLFTPANRIILDSEFVDGPTAIGFKAGEYIASQKGYLSTHQIDTGSGGRTDGAEAVQRIATENSLSPRVLLTLIEFESHWVRGNPSDAVNEVYPLGYKDYIYRGLFRQLMWATATLSAGYYNWRAGRLTELTFLDGSTLRLNPYLNAGSVAVQYYFSKTHSRAEWEKIVGEDGFGALYEDMFGPSWDRAQYYEPTLTWGISQPEISFPFDIGHVWAFTGGPHPAWEEDGALAALDFAPASIKQGCAVNDARILAPASGKVVRTGPGLVMLDLDQDGFEETGWDIMFMHVRSDGKAELGQVLQKDDFIGYSSCEGGVATGTHLHIARKYNGEWILAAGPLAFNFEGWIAQNGDAAYRGTLVRGDRVINACTCATFDTNVIREK